MILFTVLFGQFVVFQTLNTDVVEIYDGPSTDSALLSSIYGSHSGSQITRTYRVDNLSYLIFFRHTVIRIWLN